MFLCMNKLLIEKFLQKYECISMYFMIAACRSWKLTLKNDVIQTKTFVETGHRYYPPTLLKSWPSSEIKYCDIESYTYLHIYIYVFYIYKRYAAQEETKNKRDMCNIRICTIMSSDLQRCKIVQWTSCAT
jgi:hypothetical protein